MPSASEERSRSFANTSVHLSAPMLLAAGSRASPAGYLQRMQLAAWHTGRGPASCRRPTWAQRDGQRAGSVPRQPNALPDEGGVVDELILYPLLSSPLQYSTEPVSLSHDGEVGGECKAGRGRASFKSQVDYLSLLYLTTASKLVALRGSFLV